MSDRGKNIIDNISESIVFCEIDDPPSLAALHTLFEDLVKWAKDLSIEEIAKISQYAADQVEKIIMNELDEADKALKELGEITSAMQLMIVEERELGEVVLPATLMESLGENDPIQNDGQNLSEKNAENNTSDKIVEADASMINEFMGNLESRAQEMEALVLTMEKNPGGEPEKELKRIIHTMKGEAGLLSLNDIERVCHSIEDLMVDAEVGKITDKLLKVKDWLERKARYFSKKGPAPEKLEDIMKEVSESVSQTTPDSQDDSTESSELYCLTGDAALYNDFINESREHLEMSDEHLLILEKTPSDFEALNTIFRAFHTIKGVAAFLNLEDIRSLSHQTETLLDLARTGKLNLKGDSIDVIFQAIDMMKHLVDQLAESLTSNNPLSPNKELPALLIKLENVATGGDRVAKVEDNTNEAESEKVPPEENFEIPLDTPMPEMTEKIAPAPSSPEKPDILPPEEKPEQKENLRTSSVTKIKEALKVDAERLDKLIDTIGELVIAETMVSQADEVRQITSPQVVKHINHLNKISRELQTIGMSLRMVPLKGTFQKMARLVRDLSKKSGKKVEFKISGEDTELDKSVADRIGDPLVHIIRNSVDHGMEATPEDREKNGKSATGTVELRAFHKGGSIYIEIEDDGRGLDRDKILAKAKDRGLVDDASNLSDQDIYKFIFEPGFSTAAQITDVSGRGVGMDVVRRNIDALRGTIEIQSTPGKGTVISLRLPLTLAIIEGMVVRVATERYIIPTLTIISSLKPEIENLNSVLNKGETIKFQDELLPLYRVARLFEIENQKTVEEQIIVVVEDEGKRLGLVVEELMGQQQTVIKSLGEAMHDTPGVAGGAVMADGQIALILDVGGLVKLATKNP